mmetsp:Transcript_14483/g.24280  ORF Transcript_14483/g.24280 Transcript_14483/m.24280 type:complete len:640 (+) Transcript_14483:93-2012(+)
MATTNVRRAPPHNSRSLPLTSTICKCLLGFILSSWIICLYFMSTIIGCSQQNASIATSDLLLRSTLVKDATIPVQSTCQAEYSRIVSQQTPGLTPQDLLRSRALIGNQYRLERVMETLSSRERPVVAVVAGGSISLGHGLANPDQHRYSNRLENWMNDMYPLSPESTTNQDNNKGQQRHKVINVASHGADSCSMAKRLNVMYSDLESKLPPSSDEPDLIILEFAVNDYEGQDHLVQVRYQASVFFEGFMDITLCSEAVIHSLLKRYKNTAIMFLEMQTAILPRKTGALLHMGVATHYQIPVVSYAETLFHGFAELIHKLERMDPISYSFADSELMLGSGDNVTFLSTATSSTLFPYPHGCSPCQPQNIISQFRQGGCKSICTFVERSNIVRDRKLKCKANDIPSGRKECFVPYLAPDAVHPSAVGHGIVMDLLVHSLASAQRSSCEGAGTPYQNELPMTTFVAKTTNELKVRGDFLVVNDVARIFSRWDQLKPVGNPTGFERYADDLLKQRMGWIATDAAGGSKITFPIDLPPGECYVVYVAILKSYNGMGTMMVEVRDYGDKNKNSKPPKHSTKKKVDGLWQSPISVWNDVQITEDDVAGCTGYCEVDITTDPIISGRDGNKVKILTVSARRCSRVQN